MFRLLSPHLRNETQTGLSAFFCLSGRALKSRVAVAFLKDIEVPANSSATFEPPCSVDLSALPGVGWAVVAGGFDVHYELETEFTIPLHASLSPRIKTSIGGDLSLAGTVSGWTARIKERIASK